MQSAGHNYSLLIILNNAGTELGGLVKATMLFHK
jgi:hypothetical protein